MTVFRQILRSRRKSLLAWALGFVALIGITVGAYPSIAGQGTFDDMISEYPEFIQEILGLGSGMSITEPAGYLNSQFFSNMGPLLFLIFLIAFAVRETATDETDGTLDLIAAHPIPRRRLMLEKAAAMLVAGIGLTAVAVVVLVVMAPAMDMDGLGSIDLVGATVSVFLAGLVFGGMAFGLGAATGTRSIALGVSSGFAVLSFVLWGLAPLIDAISSLERLSPFFWALAGDPILNGIQGGNAALMFGVGAAFIGLGIWRFGRRDLGV